MAYPNCDVCGGAAKGVAASSLGPISLAYCQECLSRGAEPIGMWHLTIGLCDGPDGVRPEFTEHAASYKNGRYIGWDEIASSYSPEVE
jgi:hypothetical protein